MKKLFFRLVSVFAVFVLLLGNSYSAGASSIQNQAAAIPAFPGAEGFGANAFGGRGGTIFEVTNLNNSGAGSLRACVEASGARTCVFRTGGLIVLQSVLKIVNPYITIAGQTAPGGGITLKTASGGDIFSTQTHDVVIRYITARPGPGGENHANQIAKNGVELYNIVIDHNSLSWGVDSNIETWYRVRAATIQWSLISEGLNNSTHSKGAHSKGLMIGGYQGSESGGKGSENISVLNNLMAHNADRNPLMQLCGIAQVMNNVTYNPMYTFSHQQLNCTAGESYINWINNYHKKGPSSTSNSDLKVIPADSGTWSAGKIYVKGNIGPNRPNDTLPDANWVEFRSGAPAGILVTSPAPAPVVYSTSAVDAYNSVIADGGVGNSRGLNCDGTWYNRRDTIDARVINEVKTGTGKIIDDPSQVGGWIVPAAGTACADGDHDGMPDVWEQAYGLNLNSPNSSVDQDGDGYTNVEEYLNGTNPLGSVSSTPTPTIAPPTNTPTVSPTVTPPTSTPTASPTVTPPATTTPTQPATTLFADVPDTYWAYSWINILYQNGITGGCGTNPLIYCPEAPVTRAGMAVFLERGIYGSNYSPPNVSTQFRDTANHWAQDWIDALVNDGISSGCGDGNFCPDSFVTRAEMAIFLLRSKYGADYVPPAASGTMFGDVPASHWAAAWIEQLAAEGVTGGCGGNNYCPSGSVNRAQMAVFLVRIFNFQ